MIFSSFLSLIFSPYKGLIKFSPKTVAGASIAPLQVLKIADNKAPKKLFAYRFLSVLRLK